MFDAYIPAWFSPRDQKGDQSCRNWIRTSFLGKGDFYARGYRVLICELSGGLPVDDLLDDGLPNNAPLQAVLDHAHQLAMSAGNAQPLFQTIQNELPNAAGVGTHKKVNCF